MNTLVNTQDCAESLPYKIVQVHIQTIKVSDTVIYNGKMHTVCGKDLGSDNGMGYTLFGDSFKLGTVPVSLVLFRNFYKGKLQ